MRSTVFFVAERGREEASRKAHNLKTPVRFRAPQHFDSLRSLLMWHMYILMCEDGSYYVGSTNNLERRFLQHVQGTGAKYTRSRKPVSCVHSEPFHTRSEAQKREAEIKAWPRAKKIQLITDS